MNPKICTLKIVLWQLKTNKNKISLLKSRNNRHDLENPISSFVSLNIENREQNRKEQKFCQISKQFPSLNDKKMQFLVFV